MNPVPTPSLPAVLTAPTTASEATPLPLVIRALVLLRLRALLRPKLFLRFLGIAAGVVAITLLSVPRGNAEQFSQWSVEVFLLKIVPLLCLVAGGGALRDEIRSFTIEYLWTRPARKAHLVIGAYVGTVLLVFVQVAIFTTLIHLIGVIRDIPGAAAHLPIALGATLGAVLAFSALSMALGVLTGKYMVAGVLYGGLIEIGLSRLPTRLNLLSVTHHVQSLLQSAGVGVADFSLLRLLSGTAGCLTIAAVGVAAAALIFTTKTYRIGDEKES